MLTEKTQGEVRMNMYASKNYQSSRWLVRLGRILICVAAAALASDAGAATRLYLQNATSSATLPATQGAWSLTTGAPTLIMSPTKAGAITSRGVAETNATNTYDVMVLKFVSDPIPAQTVTGTLNWVIGALESNTAANDYWAVHAYVVTSAGALRGTLLANNAENTTNEFPTTAQGWGTQGPKTLTDVVASANDRVVIEIGYIARNTVTTSYTATLWYGGTGGDLAAAGDETTQTGWFEFSGLDLTPPVEGSLTVTPSSPTNVPGTFTIQKAFTEGDSTVTLCEYTLNGSTWSSTGVTISGSSPNWTCSVTPPAQTNGTGLTINMRATSTGGTSTVTGSLSRTVDTIGPTDGTLSVTPGGEQNVLSWTAANDAGGPPASGLRTGSIYDVRFLAGASAPTCSTGASLYTGDLLAYTHSGLAAGQQYSYRVCAYDAVNNPSNGASGSGTPKWSSTTTSCSRCHGYGPLDGTRSGATGSVAGSHQPHNKPAYVCSVCHLAPADETSANYPHRDGSIKMQPGATGINSGYYDKDNSNSYVLANDASWTQTNNVTQLGSCRTVMCHGGNNPSTAWGSGTLPQCIQCHNGIVSALTASLITGGTVTRRDNAVGEFRLTWGHKSGVNGTKTDRGAVTDSDCIVCHLEGNFTTQKTSTYHADGYIDLRDPDGSGETPITDMSGNAFLFTRFTTTYGAGTRTTTGHTSNNVDNVLTQKFCLGCHDSDGATNPTAVTTYTTGAIAKQYMPFGGINLGANYTVLNGSAIAGGIVNAEGMFATSNSSVHPVLGPRTSDYPTAARLAAPYNNIGTTPGTRTAGAHNLADSVVLNCFDCHTSGTSLTTRTIVAHGNAATLRGSIYVSTPTLCSSCHSGYTVTGNHGSGSAMASSTGRTDEGFNNNCHYCHSSGSAKPARPRPAQDYHGFNALPSGANWPSPGERPYAFIRAWSGTAYHRPYASSTLAPGSATCGAGTCPTGGVVGDGSNRTYTPGGTY